MEYFCNSTQICATKIQQKAKSTNKKQSIWANLKMLLAKSCRNLKILGCYKYILLKYSTIIFETVHLTSSRIKSFKTCKSLTIPN